MAAGKLPRLLNREFQTQQRARLSEQATALVGAVGYGLPGSGVGQEGDEDILISFADGVPYVQASGPRVQIQDFGVFSSDNGLIFEGVSWAPYDGYSRTGRLELVPGHIYVLQIGLSGQDYYYAKMGITGLGTDTVDIIWAYQTIANLPELSNPEGGEGADIQPVVLRL